MKTEDGAVTGTVVLGLIKRLHVREDVLSQDGSVDAAKLLPVSR
jgi:hypothetical protein